jgi:peptidoglycan/LPS O-acetylase OafA/YrhL
MPPKPIQKGRIPTLDGLRAVSIALVLLGHLTGTRYFPSGLGFMGHFANFGVRVFFVISGFLITTLLLKELFRNGSISLRNFYLRRVFRIFPAAYAYVLVIAILGLYWIHLNPYDLLYAATYTTNYNLHGAWYVGHLWSLSVEEQFYLLWPAVLALWGVKRGTQVAIAMIVLSPVFRVIFFYGYPVTRPGVGGIFPTIADPLAAGCLLAIHRDWLWQFPPYRKILESRFFFIVPAIAFLGNLAGEHPFVSFVVAQPIMNLGIAATIDYFMRNSTSLVGRFLEWQPIAFIGVLSYSLYLWQQPFLDRDSGRIWSAFPLNLVLAFVLAFASYKLVEQPFLRLKERFSFEARPKPAPSPAVEGNAASSQLQ